MFPLSATAQSGDKKKKHSLVAEIQRERNLILNGTSGVAISVLRLDGVSLPTD